MQGMQRGPRFVFFAPRFPWWVWIFLLPLALLGVFLGALFLLVFLAAGIIGAAALWVRWKWLTRGMTARPGGSPASGVVSRVRWTERGYDYELEKFEDRDSEGEDRDSEGK